MEYLWFIWQGRVLLNFFVCLYLGICHLWSFTCYCLCTHTHNTARVSWNGVMSTCFAVVNGVKQGRVLSPILFCVYFDCLLYKLMKAGYGCYIGCMFVGVLAYADDDVLRMLMPCVKCCGCVMTLQVTMMLSLMPTNQNALCLSLTVLIYLPWI